MPHDARLFAAFVASAAAACLGTYEPLPEPLCGNGVVDPNEQCDDVNADAKDGCKADCTYSGAQVWSKQYDAGKGEFEGFDEVAIDSVGHIYAAGHSGDGTLGKWLQRYSPAGELQWTRDLPIDAADSFVYGLAVDSADRAVVVGEQALAAFILSVTPEGDLHWSQKPNDPEDLGYRMSDVVSHDGELLATSSVWLSMPDPADPAGDPLYYRYVNVYTFSEAGEVIDSFRYEPDDGPSDLHTYPTSNAIVAAGDGTIVIVGTYSQLDIESDSHGLIAAFTPEGELKWEDRVTNPYGSAVFNAVDVDSDGNIVALLETLNAALPLQNNNYDRTARKYDSAGELLWASSYDDGMQGYDYANDLAVDSRGNIVPVGTSVKQAWLRKLGPDGDTYWTQTVGGDVLDAAIAITIDNDDSIVVVGFLHHSLEQGKNAWIARYTP